MKSLRLLPIIFVLVSQASGASVYPTSRTCTSGESWNLDAPISDEFRSEFRAFLSEQKNPEKALRGFAEAIALRKVGQTSIEKAFAEYWIARALYAMGEVHIAFNGFLVLASRSPDPESMPSHSAAVDCLLHIHAQHPSISIPPQALATLSAELDGSAGERVLRYTRVVAWDASVAAIQSLLADDRSEPKQIQKFLANLRGAGPYEDFGRALWAAKQNDHYKTIEYLKEYFAEKAPDSLARYNDSAHLLLSRSEYSVGQFDLSENELKLVQKKSNDLTDSLSELSWANLMQERYPEAIGTSMNLEAGGLRHTFAPEAPMVAAMAMNELCQYPDAVREITIFRKNYEKSFKWLENWVANETGHSNLLYQQAIQFVRRKSEVPDRVGGEWVRSPIFIASQDEINAYFDEKENLPKVAPIAAASERAMAQEILKHARELKPELKVAKMKMKQGDQLPGKIRSSLDELRKQVVHWRRIQLAAPVWVAVSTRFRPTVQPNQDRLIARVNADIQVRNLRMLTQLEEITENVQLIEVEIYNGASQDIIWQNAHPDYKQLAKQINSERDQVVKSKTWDWGRSLASSDENSEIWEDELGSFRANLFDNCSSKDRYIAIRLKHRSGT